MKDLNRWDQALSTDFLLPQSVLAQAFTPYVTATSVPGSQYGYGWFISQAPITRHTLIWHDGVLDGFQAFNGLYVNDHITLVILSNLSTVDAISLQHELENIIFGGVSRNVQTTPKTIMDKQG